MKRNLHGFMTINLYIVSSISFVCCMVRSPRKWLSREGYKGQAIQDHMEISTSCYAVGWRAALSILKKNPYYSPHVLSNYHCKNYIINLI